MHRHKSPMGYPFCAQGPCGIPARAKECTARWPRHHQCDGAAELDPARARARQGPLRRLARDPRRVKPRGAPSRARLLAETMSGISAMRMFENAPASTLRHARRSPKQHEVQRTPHPQFIHPVLPGSLRIVGRRLLRCANHIFRSENGVFESGSQYIVNALRLIAVRKELSTPAH